MIAAVKAGVRRKPLHRLIAMLFSPFLKCRKKITTTCLQSNQLL